MKVGDTVYTVHFEQDHKLHLYEIVLTGKDPHSGGWLGSKYTYRSYQEEELFATPWQAIFYRQKELKK